MERERDIERRQVAESRVDGGGPRTVLRWADLSSTWRTVAGSRPRQDCQRMGPGLTSGLAVGV